MKEEGKVFYRLLRASMTSRIFQKDRPFRVESSAKKANEQRSTKQQAPR